MCSCASPCPRPRARSRSPGLARAGRDPARPPRHSAHLRGVARGRAFRARLRPRAGPPVADGDEPAHRLGPPRRGARRAARSRPTASCARSACAASPRRTCGTTTPRRAACSTPMPPASTRSSPAGPVLPPEFWLLRLLARALDARSTRSCWTKVMAWDLGGNWRSELLRMRLSQTLPIERIQEFLPPYPGDAAPKLPDLKALYSGHREEARAGSRVLALDPDAVAGLEQLGGRRRAQRERQAAARQRSAPRADRAAGVVLRAPARARHRRDRRHAARRARRSSSAATSASPGASPTPAPTCRTCTSSGSTRDFARREEVIKVNGARRRAPDGARLAPRPGDLRRAARRARRGAARLRARARLDRARRGRPHACRRRSSCARARDWPRVPRRGARPARAAAERELCRRRRQHRLHRRRPRAGAQAGERPAAASRRRRAGTRATTGPATCPSSELPRAFNPPGGADRPRQPQDRAAGLSAPHHLRVAAAVPRAAHRGAARRRLARTIVASFTRMQTDVVSLAVRELLPRFTAANPDHEVLKQLAAWDGEHVRRPRRAADLGRLVARVRARALRRRAGRAFHANWAARAVFTAATCSPAQSHWCDDVRTPAGGNLRASCWPIRWRPRSAICDSRYGDELELGRGARRAPPPPAVHRASPGSRAFFDIRVPSARRHLHGERRRACDFNDRRRAVRQPPRAPACGRSSDLADPQASLFIHSGGQSGNPLSRALPQLRAAWARGEYVPMITERRRARSRRRSAAGADAAQVEVVRDQRADHHRRAGDLDQREAAAERRLDARTRRPG